jgi:hypothetical protein
VRLMCVGRAYGLEGEKDIDQDTAKVLHFHIRGGAPNSVTLFLRAHPFSATFYTELGGHRHVVTATVSDEPVELTPHVHDLTVTGTTGADPVTHGHGSHEHGTHYHLLWTGSSNSELPLAQAQILTSVAPGFPTIWTNGEFVPNTWFMRRGNPQGKNYGDAQPEAEDESWVVKSRVPGSTVDEEGAHTPGLTGNTAPSLKTQAPAHHHQFQVDSADTGATAGSYGLPHTARTGARLDYFAGLLVDLDGTDITPQIVDRLPTSFQRLLGDGQDSHPIVTEGAGPLDLLEIAGAAGRTLDVGPHTLTFHLLRPSAGVANGGNLHYNLYVE